MAEKKQKKEREAPRQHQDPLTDRERRWVERMFSDPFSIPQEWKAWIKAWLEENPPVIPYNTLSGIPPALVDGGSGLPSALPGQYGFFASTKTREGWVYCDGASHPTASYPDLFADIGYTYGGSGANFNVPDCRGRSFFGLGTHGDVNAITDNDGLVVGTRTPKHSHPVSDPSHSHSGSATPSGEHQHAEMGAVFSSDSTPGSGSGAETVAADTGMGGQHGHGVSIGDSSTGISVGPSGGPSGGPAFMVAHIHIKT